MINAKKVRESSYKVITSKLEKCLEIVEAEILSESSKGNFNCIVTDRLVIENKDKVMNELYIHDYSYEITKDSGENRDYVEGLIINWD